MMVLREVKEKKKLREITNIVVMYIARNCYLTLKIVWLSFLRFRINLLTNGKVSDKWKYFHFINQYVTLKNHWGWNIFHYVISEVQHFRTYRKDKYLQQYFNLSMRKMKQVRKRITFFGILCNDLYLLKKKSSWYKIRYRINWYLDSLKFDFSICLNECGQNTFHHVFCVIDIWVETLD